MENMQADNGLFTDEYVDSCKSRADKFKDLLYKEFPSAYSYWSVKVGPLNYIECFNVGYPVMVQYLQDSIFVYGPWDINCATFEQTFKQMKEKLEEANSKK